MKPPAVRYARASDVREAVSLLAEHGSDAKVLAGGQSLVPLMNFRLARPSVLVDINRVAGLDRIEVDNGSLLIGAMARQRDVELSEVAAAAVPLLPQALRHVGHVTIRNRGTVGGSLAHADPAAELPALVTALGGELLWRGRTARARSLPRTTSWGPSPPQWSTTRCSSASGCRGCPPAPASPWRSWPDGTATSPSSVRWRPSTSPRTERSTSCGWPRAASTRSRCGCTPPRRSSPVRSQRGGDRRRRDDRRPSIHPTDDVHAPASYRRDMAQLLVKRALGAAVERSGASA